MKTRTLANLLFASFGAASFMALGATAQTADPSAAPAVTPAPTASAPATLPYGVEDVLKLSRAQVSEDVTLNFIHNSGTIYNLSPKDIVYLRNEGVSDRVINAMMDQRKNVPTEAAAQSAAATPPAAAPAPIAPDANAATAPPVPQYAPTYAQAAPVYVQPDATPAPASTVYVIPYSSSGYAYPNYYPYYYGGYPCYYGPSVVVGFGYYGGRYHHGYYGGYHGGYHGGGHYGYGGHH